MKVAAVQLEPAHGDLPENLRRCERLADEAGARGAEWIVLPEFLTTGMAFLDRIADAALPPDGAATELMLALARRHGAVVGGSFICRDTDGHNPARDRRRRPGPPRQGPADDARELLLRRWKRRRRDRLCRPHRGCGGVLGAHALPDGVPSARQGRPPRERLGLVERAGVAAAGRDPPLRGEERRQRGEGGPGHGPGCRGVHDPRLPLRPDRVASARASGPLPRSLRRRHDRLRRRGPDPRTEGGKRGGGDRPRRPRARPDPPRTRSRTATGSTAGERSPPRCGATSGRTGGAGIAATRSAGRWPRSSTRAGPPRPPRRCPPLADPGGAGGPARGAGVPGAPLTPGARGFGRTIPPGFA
jgi:hypothetical protein